MIIVESKRKPIDALRKAYPGATIIDVTSHAQEPYVRFSPFYPHGDIPVPGYDGLTGASVEGIWQGLKVFATQGVDIDTIHNDTMKKIKRTTRRFGPCKGHQMGRKLLGYLDARLQIYLPTYRWVLENKLADLVDDLRQKTQAGQTLILLDFETNPNPRDLTAPLSHASLIKAHLDNTYPT